MNSTPAILATCRGLGSVKLGRDGLVQLELAGATLLLSVAQFQRLVVLLMDSAANFELQCQHLASLDSPEDSHA